MLTDPSGHKTVEFYEHDKPPKKSYLLYAPKLFDKESGEGATDIWVNLIIKDYNRNFSSILEPIPINSYDELSSFWSKIGYNTETVVLLMHGKATGMNIDEENLSLDMINDLSNGKIKEILLLSCNAGHNSYSNNVAKSLSSANKNAYVYASDGTLYGDKYGNLTPTKDGSWVNQNLDGDKKDDKLDGYLVYKNGREMINQNLYSSSVSNTIKTSRKNIIMVNNFVKNTIDFIKGVLK